MLIFVVIQISQKGSLKNSISFVVLEIRFFVTWFSQVRQSGSFEKVFKINFLYKYLNFSAGFILPQSFADKAILTNKLRKHYIKPFRNPSERLGTIGFSKSLLNDQGWFEELWSKRASISEKRTLFIWGMADKFILPKYLEKFEREFTDRISVKFQDCGHYPQEEKKELVVSEIQSWLQGLGCVNQAFTIFEQQYFFAWVVL